MDETLKNHVSNDEETSENPSETFFNKVVGISEAASITGRSKGQIGRDSNTNRLIFMTDQKGQKRYKVADLYQLYGFRTPKETFSDLVQKPNETVAETPLNTETAVRLAVLEAEVRAKSEALQRMENENLDLRQTRDRLLEQNNRLTLLLPAPTIQTFPEPKLEQEPISSVPSNERKPFWKRLFA